MKSEKTTRPWQEIARELVTEKDSKRIKELSEELMKALDEQLRKPRVNPCN